MNCLFRFNLFFKSVILVTLVVEIKTVPLRTYYTNFGQYDLKPKKDVSYSDGADAGISDVIYINSKKTVMQSSLENLLKPVSVRQPDSGTNSGTLEGLAVSDGLQYEAPTARIVVTVRRKRSSRRKEPWEINYNVCPPSICTAHEEKRPRGTAGSVFYNGDIILDAESEKIIFENGNGNGLRLRYRRATMRSSRTWRNATVPYVFASDIAPLSKSVIRKAIREIENKTCINFRRKRLRDEDYIRFISEPGCWSSVGRVGGEQKVSIGPGCERIGTAIHEISHALGFWHEQARPDRDKYVKIIEENISPRYLPDFSKANSKLVTSRGYPYDYESVMHYSKKAFTNLGEDTIKVIGLGKKLGMRIGQREQLSTIDIAQLRDMYKCNDKEDDKVSFCPKDWVKIDRGCYKFESDKKEQFSAAYKHCDSLNSKLLFIDDENEDEVIKRYVKKKFPDVKVWRTGGRVVNGTFVWYRENNNHDPMEYTHWKKGHPSSYSSLALVYNRKKDRVRWEGVWLGSYSQLPEHAYPFICERRARRRCIPGDFSDGRDYRGTLDHTMDGYTCQKWSSQYPWAHNLLSYPYNGTGNNTEGLGDHNFCRNPEGDRRSRPWCYTTKSKYKWQYCDISICSKKDSSDESNKLSASKPKRNAILPDKSNKGNKGSEKAQKDQAADKNSSKKQATNSSSNKSDRSLTNKGTRKSNSTKKNNRKDRKKNRVKDKNNGRNQSKNNRKPNRRKK